MFICVYALLLLFLLAHQLQTLAYLFFRRQCIADFLHTYIVIRSHTHRSLDTLESPFHFCLALYKQSDGGIVLFHLQQSVHGIDIEIQLTSKFLLKSFSFQFTYDIAMKQGMVKKHVYPARLAGNNEFFLPPKKSEAIVQFQEEACYILLQFIFRLRLFIVLRKGNQSKNIGILGDFLCQTTLFREQIIRNVSDGSTLTFIQLGMKQLSIV